MPIRALFIIDPPEHLDPPTDTTLAIMRESLSRGQQVSFTTLDGLRLTTGGLRATARSVEFAADAELFTPGPARDFALGQDCDLVWLRKDPPVDLAYLHSTYLLDFLPRRVLQINPPAVLRDVCEKLAPAHFPELFPPTLVSRSPADLATFVARQGRAVLKPLEECSGRGIVLVDAGSPELATTIARATENGRRFVQAQRYLADIATGDIRVLMLGGEILGWVRRLPRAGDFRSNVNAGGHCEPCTLGPREKDICALVGPWLRKREIHFAGIDIVGEYLLEINLTSPSCLREMNALYGWRLEATILDYVETRVSAGRT